MVCGRFENSGRDVGGVGGSEIEGRGGVDVEEMRKALEESLERAGTIFHSV